MFSVALDSPRLRQALTHPSYANEQSDEVQDNQRLEFLGDAVLGLCVSELLCERFPGADEGQLTRMRAQLVSTQALADWGRSQDLASQLRLGRGAEGSGLGDTTSVLADAVEAVIAAVFLEGGLPAARAAVAHIVAGAIRDLDTGGARDPKTQLQERVQQQSHSAPRYELLESWGPDHERWFKVRVAVADQWLAEGVGRSKRTAEREAAREALAVLNLEAAVTDSKDE